MDVGWTCMRASQLPRERVPRRVGRVCTGAAALMYLQGSGGPVGEGDCGAVVVARATLDPLSPNFNDVPPMPRNTPRLTSPHHA